MMKQLPAIVLVVVVALCPWRIAASVSVSLSCGNDETSCAILVGQSLNLTIVQSSLTSQSVTYHFLYSDGSKLQEVCHTNYSNFEILNKLKFHDVNVIISFHLVFSLGSAQTWQAVVWSVISSDFDRK